MDALFGFGARHDEVGSKFEITQGAQTVKKPRRSTLELMPRVVGLVRSDVWQTAYEIGLKLDIKTHSISTALWYLYCDKKVERRQRPKEDGTFAWEYRTNQGISLTLLNNS